MAQTPWGDLTVADAHVHFFSYRFFSLLAGQPAEEVTARLGWTAPPEAATGLAEVWEQELAKHGVSRALLIASLPGDAPSVAEALAAFPQRFAGAFLVNPLDEKALGQAEAAFASGLRTVCLFPPMHGYVISDPRLEPLWQLTEQWGGRALVHCGVLSIGVRKRLGLPSPFDLRFGNPVDLHGVALRHPKIVFQVPHFGAGFFRETLMLLGECGNVVVDSSSSNSWMRYQEQPTTLTRVLERTLAVAGPERILFGTDSSFFPRGWNAAVFQEQVAALQELGVGAEIASKILGGNLRRIEGQ